MTFTHSNHRPAPPSLDEIVRRFANPTPSGNGISARCPSHDDRKNSLSLMEADGKILIKCHAGCKTETILSAVGLTLRDLFLEGRNDKRSNADPVIERYIYVDEQRLPLFRVCRTTSKRFFQERFDSQSGKYIAGMNDTRRVLYHLPDILISELLYIVEGEKDADILTKLGLIATTNPGGAGKWLPSYNEFLNNKICIILPDNDKPGRDHGLLVARSVLPFAKSVKLIELPDVPPKGDVSDFLTLHTKQDLISLVESAPIVESSTGATEQKDAEATRQKEIKNPWASIRDAPTLLAEEEKELRGWAKDLIIPGAVTVVAAPRGLGKTLVGHSVAVSMAKGGTFRNHQMIPLRVLIVDRDNPKRVVKDRLRSWGAADAPNLHVLTRESAPDLKDKQAWESFPVSGYDVVVIDSVGSFTEGITEKEGKETTQILATLLDLIHRGPAVLLLSNCTKDALSIRGRGEWQDRVDIIYEVRDATGFMPSGKKEWWLELPQAGEAMWAERAARRRKRGDYRLAFVPSKFRLGPEPEPFCLEIRVPENETWTLGDVTDEILKGGENAMRVAQEEEQKGQETLAAALLEFIKNRDDNAPINKTEAEAYLQKLSVPRAKGRKLIDAKRGTLWWEKQGLRSTIELHPLACKHSTAAYAGTQEQPLPTRTSETTQAAGLIPSGPQPHASRNSSPQAVLRDSATTPPSELCGSSKLAIRDEDSWETRPR